MAEPTDVPFKVRYVINSSVAWTSGGYVRFEGSQERMYFGDHALRAGDKVKITIETVTKDDPPDFA